jgi:hypothetical protein
MMFDWDEDESPFACGLTSSHILKVAKAPLLLDPDEDGEEV